MIVNNLPEKLKKFRHEHNLKRTEIARQLGISSQLYGQYEDGKYAPKTGFFLKFKETFKIDLLADNESNFSTLSKPEEAYLPEEKTDFLAPLDKEMYLRWLRRQKTAGHLTLFDDMVIRQLSHTAADLLISEKQVDLDDTRELRVTTAVKDTERYLEMRFLGK